MSAMSVLRLLPSLALRRRVRSICSLKSFLSGPAGSAASGRGGTTKLGDGMVTVLAAEHARAGVRVACRNGGGRLVGCRLEVSEVQGEAERERDESGPIGHYKALLEWATARTRQETKLRPRLGPGKSLLRLDASTPRPNGAVACHSSHPSRRPLRRPPSLLPPLTVPHSIPSRASRVRRSYYEIPHAGPVRGWCSAKHRRV